MQRSIWLALLVVAGTLPGCRTPWSTSRADAISDSQIDAIPTSHSVSRHDAVAAQTGPSTPGSPPVLLPVSDHIERGERALNAGRLDEARQQFQAVLRQQPTHPRAHHMLAVIADLQHQFASAEQHYHAALQADVGNAAVIGDLGYSYLLQERYDLAEQYLTQARALDPSHTNASRNLALLYSKRGDYHAARQALEQILPPQEVERTLSQLFPPGFAPPADAGPSAQLADGSDPSSVSDPTRDLKARMDAAAQQSILERQQRDAARQAAERQRLSQAMAMQYQAETQTPHPSGPSGAYVPHQLQSQPQPADPEYARIASELAAIDRSYHRAAPTPDASGSVSAPQGALHPPHGTTRQPEVRAVAPAMAIAERQLPDVQPVTPVEHQQPSRANRNWPPTTWPPQSPKLSGASGGRPSSTTGLPSHASNQPRSGVIHLMNRPAANNPSPPQRSAPVSDQVQESPARPPVRRPESSEASYSYGPGNSRMVTWPRSNDQPLPQPASKQLPAPQVDSGPQTTKPKADEAEEAAEIGLDIGGQHPFPVPRLAPVASPGTGSALNGHHFPQPERNLPGMPAPPNVDAASLQTPVDPLAGYSQRIAQHDELRNRSAEQVYGESPADFVGTPTRLIPAPVHQVQQYPYRGENYAAPPVNPATGEPWPGRTVEVPGTTVQPHQNNATAQPPYGSPDRTTGDGYVVPPPYTAAPANTAPLSAGPSAWSHSSSQTSAYSGPVIIPGSR